ncbi:signal peptidase I [Candidatus Peregrinibacteria bacterium]|nr:signal peptidase I [Candidatus Peregrinibacteria bacterium]
MSPFNISGDSMEPVFSDGDIIMTESLTYMLEDPARGDIIVFFGTDEPDKYFVKRIIGLPGETIKISEDNVYLINDKGEQSRIEEFYLNKQAKAYSLRQIDGTVYEVPADSYFVLGDNRDSSFDSRTWHSPFVPKNNIVGKYYFVLF